MVPVSSNVLPTTALRPCTKVRFPVSPVFPMLMWFCCCPGPTLAAHCARGPALLKVKTNRISTGHNSKFVVRYRYWRRGRLWQGNHSNLVIFFLFCQRSVFDSIYKEIVKQLLNTIAIPLLNRELHPGKLMENVE